MSEKNKEVFEYAYLEIPECLPPSVIENKVSIDDDRGVVIIDLSDNVGFSVVDFNVL